MVNIDERVLTMKFDNSQFRRAAAETIGALEKLKSSMKIDSAASGFSKLGDPVKTLAKSIRGSSINNEFKSISKAASTTFSDIDNAANRVRLDGLTSGVDRARKSFVSLGDVASVALGTVAGKGIEKVLGGVKSVYDATLGQIASGGMRRATNLEQANYMLGGIMKTQEQVNAVMKAANDAVTGTAYGLDEAAKAAGQFAASNVPIERMEATLKGVAGVAAMTGSSFDEISAIFTSVAGTGKLMTQDLRQFEGRGLNVAAKLAEKLGTTEGDIRDMVTKSKISFETFSEAMSDAYGAQAAKANDTYAGSLSNLRAALSRIGADTAAVKLRGMRDVFNGLRPIVNGVHNALKPFIAFLNSNLTNAFARVVAPLTKLGDAFTNFFKFGPEAAGSLRPVVEFVQDLGMIGGLVIEVFQDMMAVIGGASPRFIEVSNTATSAGTKIQHIFRKLLSVLMLVPEFIGMVIKAFRGTSDSAQDISLSFLDIVDAIASFLYQTAEFIRKTKIFEVGAKVLGTALRFVFKIISVVANALADLTQGFVKFSSPLQNVGTTIAQVFGAFKSNVFDKFVSSITSGIKKISKVASNFSLSDFIDNFKMPKNESTKLQSLRNVFGNIGDSISKITDGLKSIDWSPITSMFSNGFKLPSLNDVKTIGSGIGSSVMGGLHNLSSNPIVAFAKSVKNAFSELLSYLRGINWSNVWFNFKTSFENGIRSVSTSLSNLKSSVGRNLSDFGKWIVDGLQNVNWSDVGASIGNGIVKSISFITESAGKIASAIGDFFKAAFDAIDWSAMLDGLKKTVETVSGAFDEIGKAFQGLDIDTSYLENAVGSATAEATINISANIGKQTKNVRDHISDFLAAIFGTGPTQTPEESTLYASVSNFGESIGKLTGFIKKPLSTTQKAATKEIEGFGKNLNLATTDAIANIDVVGALNALGMAFTGVGIFKVAKSIEAFAEVPKAIAGTFDAISGSIKSLGDSLQGFADAAKIEAQGNSILKVGIAFGILAAVVWFMSKIPFDNLKNGMGAVLGLIAALVASAIILDKTISEDGAEKIGKLGDAFMKIGIAVGILAASIWFLGKMDPEALLQGFLAVVGTIAALAGGAALAGVTKSVAGIGAAFMGLAIGVAILAQAFLMFKLVDWEDIKKGLSTLGVSLLAISVAARIADGKKLAGAGAAMLGVGAGLWALAFGIKAISDLDEDQLKKGLGVLAGIMLGLTALGRFGGSGLSGTISSFMGLSVSMLALAFAAKLLADVPFRDAAGGMAVMVGGLVVLGVALRAFPKTLPAMAGSLITIAVALGVLVAAVYILGSLDLVTLATGVGAIVVTLGLLAVVLKLIPAASITSMLGLSVAFIVFAGSIYVLALAMRTLEGVDWSSLGKAGAIAAGVLVALTALAAIGTFGGAGIATLGGALAILGLGLMAIAGAAAIFAGAVDKIAGALKTISDIGPTIQDALKNAGAGITDFANEASDGFQKLFDDIGLFDVPKISGIADLFMSFEKIPQDIGTRLQGLSDGLTILDDHMGTLNELKNFSGSGGNADFLSKFFTAIGTVSPDSGTALTSLVDGIKALDNPGTWATFDKLKTMYEGGGEQSIFGNFQGTTFLKDFFHSFNDIDDNIGDKLSSISNGISQIEPVFETIKKLNGMYADGGKQSIFGNFQGATYLKDFFHSFNDLDDNIGDKLTSVSSGITQLSTVMDQITGLQKLYEGGGKQSIFGNFKDITYLKDFFHAFDDIDPDVGTKISGVVSAMNQIAGVEKTIEDLQSLYEGGGSRNWFTGNFKGISYIKDFFHAFDDIDPNAGVKMEALSGAFASLQNVWGQVKELQSLYSTGGEESKSGYSSISYVKDFFNSFNDIDPKAGENATNVANAIGKISEVWGAVSQINTMGVSGDDGSVDLSRVRYIRDFFNAFNEIDTGVGDKISSVAAGLSQVQPIFSTIQDLSSVYTNGGDQSWLLGNFQGTKFISQFFEAFNGIDENVGEKISSVAGALTQVGQVFDTIQQLSGMYSGGGDKSWFGLGGDFEGASFISQFFEAFNGINPEAGASLSSVAGAISQLGAAWGTIQQIQSFSTEGSGDGLNNLISMFSSLNQGIPTDLGDNLSSAANGISEFGSAVPALTDAINQLSSLDTSGLGGIMQNISSAFSSGLSDGMAQSASAMAEAASGMVSSVTSQVGAFTDAGRQLGAGIGEGVRSANGDINTAATDATRGASDGVRSSYGDMVSAGSYIASGIAVGISSGQSGAINAATALAQSAVSAARAALAIHSPSRVFQEIGGFVGAGLVIGINSGQSDVRNAGSDLAKAGLEGFNSVDGDAKNAGRTFVDSLAKGMENSPLYTRLKQLSVHAKAAYATSVKERKLKEMDEVEKAEEERKRIYKEVEEARKAVSEAKEDVANSADDAKTESAKASKAEKDKAKSAAEATKATRKAQQEKDKITDAEERYQKAIRERDKYEYKMYGEEAGVEFVDGVAVGLMSDEKPLQSVAEILSDLLMGEVKTLKTKVGNYVDVFDGLGKVVKTTKSIRDNINDLGRAFRRLSTSTSSKSFVRNLEMIFDSIVGIGGGFKDLIGVLEIFAPFLPGLLSLFEANIPAISALIAPFAPELAASLGGGLAAAVPAILGPAAAIIAAVAGIGAFLWDQANDKVILNGFKALFTGVMEFIGNLPKTIVNGILIMLQGLKNTLADLPGLVEFILTGITNAFKTILEALPELIPQLISGIIEAILWIILNSPNLLLRIGTALINGLATAISVAITGLIDLLLMPFRWLTGQIEGTIDLVQVFKNAIHDLTGAIGGLITGAIRLILSPFEGLVNAIGRIFGFTNIGTNFVNSFTSGIVNAMKFAIDFIAAPFIGLYNFIAGLFNLNKVSKTAASDFIFGIQDGINKSTSKVVSATDRMAALMNKRLTSSSKTTLANVAALIDEQVKLIQTGATNGVMLGGEATRKAANEVWGKIENIFDMYGLGKETLTSLKNAFYQGTSNPETMVSSFRTVFGAVQDILDFNGVGVNAVGSLNDSLVTSVRNGMMAESMGEFNAQGTQTTYQLVDGMIKGLSANGPEIVSASNKVWDDIETVFDYYGLGRDGLDALKNAYKSGTENPETFSATFAKVFDAVEKQLLLKGIGTESVEALRASMVDSVTNLLQPDVRDSFSDVRDETRSIFSRESGSAIGTGLVEGIIEGIVNTFRGLWDFVTRPFRDFWSWLTGLFSGGSSLGGGFISNLIDGLTGGLRSIWDTGVNIVEGVADGIASVGEKVVNGAVDLGTRLVNGFKNFFGIKSPSRLMMKYGGYISEGLAIGIENNGDLVSDSMLGVGDGVLNTAKMLIAGIQDELDSKNEVSITPVLDLSNIKSGVNSINGLLASSGAGIISAGGFNLDSTIANTNDIAGLISKASKSAAVVNNVTNIEFNQTNTSPEALTEYQIYRNTERALASIQQR